MSDQLTMTAAPSAPTAQLGRLFNWASDRGTLITGLTLSVLVLFIGFVGPFIYPVGPFAIHPNHALEAPSWAFPFGTDELGRDELALLLSGGLATLLVSRILMRLLDAVLALPSLIILLFFASLVTLDNTSLILLLGFISWPSLARLVRNETMAQTGRDFVLATEQLGAGRFYIARVHLLRVMAPILVVNGTFMIGDAIFALSALSFLGLGVQPPQVSWGSLLETGLDIIALDPWWMILPPGIVVFTALLAASLTGQGLLARWGNRR